MKKAIVTLAILSSIGFTQSSLAATPNIGQASFQWSGTVPAPSVSAAGYWLVSHDGQSLLADTNTHNGVMTFENRAGVINLVDSSAFSFKVVKDRTSPTVDTANGEFEPAIDTVGVPYHVSLSSIASGSGGFPAPGDQDGYFTVTSNGAVISATADKAHAIGEAATIKVAKATTSAQLEGATAGQKWQVAAQVAVSTTAL